MLSDAICPTQIRIMTPLNSECRNDLSFSKMCFGHHHKCANVFDYLSFSQHVPGRRMFGADDFEDRSETLGSQSRNPRSKSVSGLSAFDMDGDVEPWGQFVGDDGGTYDEDGSHEQPMGKDLGMYTFILVWACVCVTSVCRSACLHFA